MQDTTVTKHFPTHIFTHKDKKHNTYLTFLGHSRVMDLNCWVKTQMWITLCSEKKSKEKKNKQSYIKIRCNYIIVITFHSVATATLPIYLVVYVKDYAVLYFGKMYLSQATLN